MKTLALDFGERRIGLALSDPEGRVAVPLATLVRTSDRDAVREIAGIVRREEVEVVVIGDPVHVDGSRGDASERVRRFAAKLAEATGIEPRFVLETLTTVAARERLQAAGVDLRKHPERLDATAAQILLEEALQDAVAPAPRLGEEAPDEEAVHNEASA
jgi:putative Holliday junction resolvase